MCIKQFGDCHNQKNYIKNCRCVGMRVLAIPVFFGSRSKKSSYSRAEANQNPSDYILLTCSQLFQRRRIVQIHKNEPGKPRS